MRTFSILFKSVLDLLRGKRHAGFYFATLSFWDSLLALFYSLAVLMNLPVARKGKVRFKALVKEMFGAREIYLYGSARSALYAHLNALALEPGDEVIITGFTCEVVPNAVINAGLRPVYADIDPETYCMTADTARRVLSHKTKALIVQHTFGIASDLDSLLDFARKHDLYVIEDCAVSLGTLYKGRLTGSFGDAAIFSFELSKTITSCWGGMLLINTGKWEGDKKHRFFYQSVPQQQPHYSSSILMQLGLSGILFRPVLFNLGKYVAVFMYRHAFFKTSTSEVETKAGLPPGYLYALSDQQAVLLLRQIKRLPQIVGQSQSVARYYQRHLADLHDLSAYCWPEGANYNMIRYPIHCGNRQDLILQFQIHNLDLGLWFTAPLSAPEVDHQLFGYHWGDCPEAEAVAATVCNLPTNLRVTEAHCEAIVRLCSKTIQ